MGREHYCFCSPSRVQMFGGEELRATYRRWTPSEDYAAYQPPGVYADGQPGPRLATGE